MFPAKKSEYTWRHLWMTHYQVKGITLKRRVLEDVEFRQCRVWRRMIAVTTSEAAMRA